MDKDYTLVRIKFNTTITPNKVRKILFRLIVLKNLASFWKKERKGGKLAILHSITVAISYWLLRN